MRKRLNNNEHNFMRFFGRSCRFDLNRKSNANPLNDFKLCTFTAARGFSGSQLKACRNTARGFTLAEVLITLVIIGVIAAITIPNLMQSWRRHERISQIKTAYSIIQNATKMAVAEHGNPDGWDINGAPEYVQRYFLPYVKVQKECGKSTNQANFFNKGCFKSNGTSLDNGTWHSLNGNIYDANGRDSGYGPRYYYTMILQNGMHLGVWAAAKQNLIYKAYRNIIFVVDVDGKQGTSTLGKDVFSFTFNIDSNKFETGSTEASCLREINNSTADCNLNGTGLSCARRIELNHWEFPDDYPVKKF